MFSKVRTQLPVVLILFALGAGIRVYHATTLHQRQAWQHGTNQAADHGIVGLMAKHVAEGKPWPAFFYGQDYMGSLEPLVSAAVCRALDISMPCVAAGTALVGFWVLPLVYAWGKRAGGGLAGLAAAAYLAAGPDTFFWFSSAPRGGYMMTLILGMSTLLLSTSLTAGCIDRQGPARFSSWKLALTALLGGLAWWTNQLSIVYLLPSAGILMVAWRYWIRWRYCLPAGIAFLVGSSPWWLWQSRNGWTAMGFRNTFSTRTAASGTEALVRYTGSFLMGETHPAIGGMLLLATVATLLFFGICLHTVLLLRKRDHAGLLYLSAAFALWSTNSVFFVFSRLGISHGGARFLLPTVPVMALLVGITTQTVRRKTSRLPAILFLALTLAPQARQLHAMSRDAGKDRAGWNRASALLDFCQSNGIEAVYGGYDLHWVNFATREQLCYTSGLTAGSNTERYGPYIVRAALSDHFAFRNNYEQVQAFLGSTACTWKTNRVAGQDLTYAIEPPIQASRLTPGTNWTIQASSASPASATELRDENLSTGIDWDMLPGCTRAIDINIGEPADSCGLRMYSMKNQYPLYCKVMGADAPEAPLRELTRETWTSAFFWSGPMICRGGRQYVLELRWPPRRTQCLRIILTSGTRHVPVHIGEIEILRPSPGVPARHADAERILAALHRHGVERLYAPLWLSERAWESFNGNIETYVPAAFRRGADSPPVRESSEPIPVQFTGKTAIVSTGETAERLKTFLPDAGGGPALERGEGWAVLIVDGDNLSIQQQYPASLAWTEHGIFRLSEDRHGKRRAHQYYLAAATATNRNVQASHLQAALQSYPNHGPAARLLVNLLPRGLARKNDLYVPDVAARAHFDHGLVFLGCDVSTLHVRPGQSFEMQFYWRCPPGVDPASASVFVHFRGANRQFEADHPLLENIPPHDLSYQPFEEVFRQAVRVTVPKDLPPGVFGLYIGLYEPIEGVRFKVRSRFLSKNRCIAVPIALQVGDG
jgi:hypothetical protein